MSDDKKLPLNRRAFLQEAAAVSVGTAATIQAGSSTCLAADSQFAKRSLAYASIGTGIRGKGLVKDASNFASCKAICDVDEAHRLEAEQSLAEHCKSKERPPMTPELLSDYRQVLSREDIDFVTIGTPDHWHTKIAIEAMKAGKDVYCEKPLTLTIEEGQQILKTLEATNRVFQVGTQQRSSRLFQKAVALQRAGRVGKAKRVTCALGGAPSSGPLPTCEPPVGFDWNQWLGPAPPATYRQDNSPKSGGYGSQFPRGRGHAHFRWWYEYSGGKLTDWGAHHVDIAMWALDKSDGGIGRFTLDPLLIEHPVDFAEGMPVQDDRFNTATRFHVRVTFSDGVELDLRHHANEDLGFGNGIMFQGDKGRFFVNREKLTGKPVEELESNPLPAELFASIHPALAKGNFWQMSNFIDCVRTRETPISDVASHHRHLTVCHAANIALRLDRKLVYDPAVERFVDDDQANSFLRREPRQGFEILG
ncbi:MAG: Gfo/Idh/MocA family oxidoreductase [Planctomycetota bacterium]